MTNNQTNQYSSKDPDIFDSLLLLWSEKSKIISITFIFIIISIGIILFSPQKFTSSALLSPVDDSTFSAGLGAYAGLATMAGIDLGAPATSKTDIAIEVLKSREFFVKFSQKRGLEPYLFAVKLWDSSKNEIVFNKKKYNASKNQWVNGKKFNTYKAHKIWVEDILSISRDTQTNLVSISIKHQSPTLASEILNWLLQDIDKDLRDREIASSSKAIEFLEKEADKASSDELKKLFYALIQDQTNKKMIAVTHPDFIFEIIDPPFVPEVKSEPKSFLILISFTFLGFIVAVLFIFIVSLIKNKQPEKS